MANWVALFRGINVGGKNVLPMAELRRDLESLSLSGVRTYIQSGNVVFDAAARAPAPLAKKIGDLIHDRHGFRPQLLLLKSDDLRKAITGNPFSGAVAEPANLHFFFLAEPAAHADLEGISKAASETEKYALTPHVFYLHAPEGIGRSRLAANAERLLGVVTTARNYRTVEKLLTLAAL